MDNKIDVIKKNNTRKPMKDQWCKMDVQDKIKGKFFIDKLNVENIGLNERLLNSTVEYVEVFYK